MRSKLTLPIALLLANLLASSASAADVLNETFTTDPINTRATVEGDQSRFTYDSSAKTLTAHYDTSLPTTKLVWGLGQTFDQSTPFRVNATFSVSNLVAPTGFGGQLSFGLINGTTTGSDRSGGTAGPFAYDVAQVDYFPNFDPSFSAFESLAPSLVTSNITNSTSVGDFYNALNFPFSSESLLGQTSSSPIISTEPSTLNNRTVTISLAYNPTGILGQTLTMTMADSLGLLPINTVGDSGLYGGLDSDPTTIQLTLPNGSLFSTNEFALTLWNDSNIANFGDPTASADFTFSHVQVSNLAATPEPSTLVLAALGGVGICLGRRFKKRQTKQRAALAPAAASW